MSKRMVLFGGSGLIGRALARRLGRDRAVCTFRSRPVEGGIRYDALTADPATVLDQAGPASHALLLFANSDTRQCATDPEATRQVNVAANKRVIDALLARGIMPVFFSSDGVFDGEKGNYVEDDPVKPVMEYGKQKAEVERYLRERTDDFLILRPARVYGAAPGAGTMLDDWLQAVTEGHEIVCAHDTRFCPIDVDDLATLVTALVENDTRGVFHTGGPESATHWSLLKSLLDALDAEDRAPPLVLKSILDLADWEPRPLDTSLVSTKAYEKCGFVPADPESVIAAFARSAHAGQNAPAQRTSRHD